MGHDHDDDVALCHKCFVRGLWEVRLSAPDTLPVTLIIDTDLGVVVDGFWFAKDVRLASPVRLGGTIMMTEGAREFPMHGIVSEVRRVRRPMHPLDFAMIALNEAVADGDSDAYTERSRFEKHMDADCPFCSGDGDRALACPVARPIVLALADHPDFDPAWASSPDGT